MIPLNEQKTGSRICRSRLRYENRIGIDWHKITQTSCVLHICLAQKTNQSHETSWNLERVHIYMHVRPWLKWWNSNRPVHRRRVLTWPGLHIVVQTRDGPQNPLDSLWMTKLSGFLGQEFHPASENRESTQFLLVRHLRSLKISWISSIQRPPCGFNIPMFGPCDFFWLSFHSSNACPTRCQPHESRRECLDCLGPGDPQLMLTPSWTPPGGWQMGWDYWCAL